MKARLRPLEDGYFNGLSSIEIAGLAKKSIRITAYNRELENALEEVKQEIDSCKYNAFDDCRTKLFKDLRHIITEAIGE